jgi:hypothetical protein
VNPERELSLWESMATAYETFTTSRTLTLAAKKEVFGVVLLRSGAPEEEVLKHLKLKVLTEKDARDIMRLFSTQPQAVSGASWLRHRRRISSEEGCAAGVSAAHTASANCS